VVLGRRMIPKTIVAVHGRFAQRLHTVDIAAPGVHVTVKASGLLAGEDVAEGVVLAGPLHMATEAVVIVLIGSV
jgi:hypothetical protein